MNESRFIPLFYCHAWLEKINKTLRDSVLQAQLDVLKPDNGDIKANALNRSVSRQLQIPIQTVFEASTLFIGRPQKAYGHVLDHLLGSEMRPRSPVKACFCLFQSTEDSLPEFGDALGARLVCKAKEKLPSQLLLTDQAYRFEYMDVNIWGMDEGQDYPNEEYFLDVCLQKVGAILIGSDFQRNQNEELKSFCSRIFVAVQNRQTKPIILLSEGFESGKRISAAGWFSKQRILRKIQRCRRWIENFNQLWQDAALRVNSQDSSLAIVLIFGLWLDPRLMASSTACFSLQPITPNDVQTWLIQVRGLLSDLRPDSSAENNRALTKFKVKFAELQGGETVDYRISFLKFRNDTESIINLTKMNPCNDR